MQDPSQSPSASPSSERPATIRWQGGLDGRLELLDQTRLPHTVVRLDCEDLDTLVGAIKRLSVRGAPAIGIAAAYGYVLGCREALARSPEAYAAHRVLVRKTLLAARPTAVNLRWAVERLDAALEAAAAADGALAPHQQLQLLLEEAHRILEEDRAACHAMGAIGARLLEDGQAVLTHCNAGGLATSELGTALAPVIVAHRAGKRLEVFADETRPLLQGARLTAYEMREEGIPVTVLCDGAAASLLATGRIAHVIVGADRVAANGDVCNKIGTYAVALAAQRHRVPFHVVAPTSTIDTRAASGADIPIEERSADEVLGVLGQRIAPEGVRAYAPAFDLTPAELVTTLITERGAIARPDAAAIRAALA